MADNITLNSGSGGSTLKTDENASSEHYQIVKLADGTADSDTVIESGAGTAAGALRVELPTDGTGVVGLNAGANLIGEISVGAATTAAGDLAKAEDAVAASGDVGVFVLSRRVDTTPTTSSGTTGDYSAFNTDANGCLWVAPYGNVAHDAADAGNPIKFGAKAKNQDGTTPGVVAEDDRTDLYSDRSGRLYTSSTHPYGSSASVDYGAAAQTNATIIAAAGAGLSIHITDISISNGPTAVNNVTLLDGSGGTVMFEVYMAQNANTTSNLRQPIRLTANTLLAVTSTGATELAINISYYIAE